MELRKKEYEVYSVALSADAGNKVIVSGQLTPLRPKVSENMIRVEGGMFKMGDTIGDGLPSEKPVHSVTVASFLMGKYVVTQKEWRDVMGTDPSHFKGDDLPVESVSWFDAVQYCNTLSARNGLEPCYTINGTNVTCDFSRSGFRLPTEAEWEYAAKGGRQSRGTKYAGSSSVDEVAWYGGNSGGTTHPVGQKRANELGLYDMSGNVWEWCNDWYGNYGPRAQTDPRGADRGTGRVLRGGSWSCYAGLVRAAIRGGVAPGNGGYGVGFRPVRRPDRKEPPPAAVSLTAQGGSAGEMVFVQGGTFAMGSPNSEQGRNDFEVQHQVTVLSFHMGKYDVTQGLYESVMGTNPSAFKGDPNRPVESVSWYDAVAFCNKLSERDGLQKVYTIIGTDVTADWSANGYRLPTEAEWEYAAREGRQGLSQHHVYAGSDDLGQVAWYKGNSGETTHPVGQKAPNALGLYDMNGNVWQWCWDWFGDYSSSGQNDPRGASSGVYRVTRGGSWLNVARYNRVASRVYGPPVNQIYDLGFRLVRP
jgi:formylglycine-generating enzyme required for sulfatase activity